RRVWFGKALVARGERYLLAVPSNTSVRDLEAELPPYGGKGRHPKPPIQSVRAWCEALPENAWERVVVRDAEKGPLEVEIVARRVESKIERKVVGFEEPLVVVRCLDEGKRKYDYSLSNSTRETSVTGLVRVAKAEHRIEECLKRSKSEAGLGSYEVRNWLGRHHCQALSLIATWFLVKEADRGKKGSPGIDSAAGAVGVGDDHPESMRVRYGVANGAGVDVLATAK
ncbi:IS701 family transposase, partial [Singulisphaera rosea]